MQHASYLIIMEDSVSGMTYPFTCPHTKLSIATRLAKEENPGDDIVAIWGLLQDVDGKTYEIIETGSRIQ